MRRNKLTADSGFRLIRAFTVEHNAARFRRHVDRLTRRLRRSDSVLRRIRIKRRRRERGAQI